MAIRILIAGIIGGVLVFLTGFLEHGVIGLGSRAILTVPQDAAFREDVKSYGLKPGMYMFPEMPKDVEPAKVNEVWAERYKAGPSGLMVIFPTSEEPMGPSQLVMELLTNILAALIAAWIVSRASAGASFVERWQDVPLMGLFAWLSLATSYGIWYRFPWEFIRDELLCVLIDWSVAGLAIAAIVVRPAKKESAHVKS